MRRPEIPNLDHFYTVLDSRLRSEATATTRIIPPRSLYALVHALRKLAKPLVQSAAMALTGLAVIVAVGATPAAKSGDLAHSLTTPIAAPSEEALAESDRAFLDYLPEDDILAVQEADIPDTLVLLTE
jgi:hypothetical protein